MVKDREATGNAVPFWGIFLLFLGAVFLLQTFNVLPWGLWTTLWRFWPVLLIIAGLGMLLRRYQPWLMAGISLLVLIVSLLIAIALYGQPLIIDQPSQSYTQSLAGLTRAEVSIKFDAGNLGLASLPAQSPNLAEVISSTGEGAGFLHTSYNRNDSVGNLVMTTSGNNRSFRGESKAEIWLSPSIPLEMTMESAAGNQNLDFSGLNLPILNMKIEAGNCVVVMPASGNTLARIKASVANLEITIPSGVAARIRADADIGSVEMDNRFPHDGEYYITPDFDTATSRVDLEVDLNLGRVVFK
ncbi:MAG: DUF5668 domain-containing protein [Dehalococcoidales bacterium]|jgi:hypothetical protein